MNRCYFKSLSESKNIEMEKYKNRFSYVPLRYCSKKCDGYKTKCEFFEISYPEEKSNLIKSIDFPI